MDYIQITEDNLEREHICCAISNNKDPQVISKKEWLRERLKEGLVFLKGDIRGKCFIEYIPTEYAWVPILAGGYMHINCFWVSGSCKGHGYANDLLARCIADAKGKGKAGLTVISSAKKKSFLSDPEYLAYKGFRKADEAKPYFELWYLPFTEQAEAPRFRDQVKHPECGGKGFVLYYTGGCPFTAKYVPLLEEWAKESNIPATVVKIDCCEAAQNAPAAWTNYALFYNGEYITHEILSEKKFHALVEDIDDREAITEAATAACAEPPAP